MATIANVLVALIALLHVYILVLEMFLWDKPAGLRAFGQTPEAAAASKVLAANQGLYNGFLAAGLVWGLSLGAGGTDIKVFFLCCVLVAGLYGAAKGTGARYTRSHPPVRLLAFEAHPDRSSAAQAEHRVKRLTAADKRRFAASLANPASD